MGGIDQAIIDALLAQQIFLLRFAAGERAAVLAILEKMEVELLAKLQHKGRELSEVTRADINALLAECQAVIGEYYAHVRTSSLEGLAGLGKVEADATVGAISTAFAAQIKPALPTEGFFRTLVKNTLIEGAPSADWWRGQDQAVQTKFANAVRQGLAASETNAKIVQRIRRDVMPVAQRHAAALVQTSVATVASAARQEVYDRNEDLFTGYRQVSTLDSHTSHACVAYSGKTWNSDREPIGHKLPFVSPQGAATGTPRHFNCLPGDALVTTRGDITGVSKRWFDGKVVVIKTASGREFTSTPNHPVLTPRGWVAAGRIDVGGHVIGDGGSEWGGIGNRNSEDVPTAMEEFTESWLGARNVSAVPVPLSAEDFHGDGGGSKVAVVFSDGLLRGGLDTSFEQHTGELGFIGRLAARAVALGSGSHREQAGRSGWPSSNGVIRCAGEALAFLWRGARHAGRLLLAPVADLNAMGFQQLGKAADRAANSIGNGAQANAFAVHRGRLVDIHFPGAVGAAPLDAGSVKSTDDGIDADAKLGRDYLRGFTGSVFADEVVSVDVRNFSGHVFNLETKGGWYSANGIVTHNCRSLMVPTTKTYKELGLDVPEFRASTKAATGGPVSSALSFDDFLKRKGDKFADDLLGKGRADLWRSGTITLSALLDQSGRPLTLAQLRAKYQ